MLLENVALERCTIQNVVCDDNTRFQLNSMAGMKMICTCDTASTRDQWICELREAITHAKKRLLAKLEQTVPRRRPNFSWDSRSSVLLHSILEVAIRILQDTSSTWNQYSSTEVFLLPDRLLYGSDNLMLELSSIQKTGDLEISVHSITHDGKGLSISIRCSSAQSADKWYQGIKSRIQAQKEVLRLRLQPNNLLETRKQPPGEDCGSYISDREPDFLDSTKVKVQVIRRGKNN
jgi:hypothetical protein